LQLIPTTMAKIIRAKGPPNEYGTAHVAHCGDRIAGTEHPAQSLTRPKAPDNADVVDR